MESEKGIDKTKKPEGLDDKAIVNILNQADAIQHGEFVLRGGEKTTFKIDAEKVAEKPDLLKAVAAAFAEKIQNCNFDTIIGVANGGIPFAEAVAQELSLLKGTTVHWCEAVKMPDKTFCVPQSSLTKDAKVFILDDVGTTGSGIRATIQAAEETNSTVAGAGYIFKRGDIGSKDVSEYPFFTLNEEPLENHLM